MNTALLLLTSLLGQTTIDAPSEVEPYKPIVVTANVVAPEGSQVSYLWDANTVESIVVNDKILHVWAPPGKHTIELITFAINWEARTSQVARVKATISVKGSVVNPPDPPSPPDDPNPPTVKAVSALIVYEKDDLTSTQSLVMNSIRNTYTSGKLKMLDKDAQTTANQPFLTQVLEHIGSQQLPVVVAVQNDSSLGAVVEMPNSAAQLSSLLKSWGIEP